MVRVKPTENEPQNEGNVELLNTQPVSYSAKTDGFEVMTGAVPGRARTASDSTVTRPSASTARAVMMQVPPAAGGSQKPERSLLPPEEMPTLPPQLSMTSMVPGSLPFQLRTEAL